MHALVTTIDETSWLAVYRLASFSARGGVCSIKLENPMSNSQELVSSYFAASVIESMLSFHDVFPHRRLSHHREAHTWAYEHAKNQSDRVCSWSPPLESPTLKQHSTEARAVRAIMVLYPAHSTDFRTIANYYLL